MQPIRPHPHLATPLLAALLVLTGCDNNPRPTHTLTILAAASLTESVADITTAYQAEHPDTRITIAFAGSQILAAQILQGASFDLFLAADDFQMNRIADLVDNPVHFAAGRLVVIAPASTTHPDALDALDAAKRIAIAAPEVPAGRYTRDALEQLNLWDTVRPKALSLEESVRGVLTRVVMGEADTGVVYASDTRAAPANTIIIFEFPPAVTTRPQYLAAINLASPNKPAAQAFLDYLTTNGRARAALRAHDLESP